MIIILLSFVFVCFVIPVILLCILLGAFQLVTRMVVGIIAFIGIIFLLIQLIPLYKNSFPSLEDQLFNAVSKKCGQQSSCKIYLHELTSFKWDKAYFFSKFSHYTNQDIERISGIHGDFQRDKNLAIFLYHGKVVEYGYSDIPEEIVSIGRPSQDHYFNMFFSLNKQVMYGILPPRDMEEFNKYKNVDYYELTPQNDLLYVWFITLGDYYYGYSTQSWANHTNPTQARWLPINH